MNIIDLTGHKFGKLTVIKMSEKRSNSGKIRFECLCECGNKHEVSSEGLKKGKTKSCGCLVKETKRWNYINDREYATWKMVYAHTILKRSKGKYISDIELDDFITISKKPCYYCGLDNSNSIKDRASDFILKFNGLDRINSDVGYYLSNVVSCCKYCNCAKNNMSMDEFKSFIIRLYNNFI